VIVLILVLSLLLAFGSITNADPLYNPPPGCNGDIKVHNGDEEPSPIQQDHPKVGCSFHLHGFNFDPGSEIVWYIKIHPDTGEDPVLSGILIADANGEVRTELLSLPTDMYKVFWHQTGCPGGDKHKVFKVECEPPPPADCNEPPNESGCKEGLTEHEGLCRNPACLDEADCTCPPPPADCNEPPNESGCKEGLTEHEGLCRNPACLDEADCTCPPPPADCNEPPNESGCKEGLGEYNGLCRNLACPEQEDCKPQKCNQVCSVNSDCADDRICHNNKCRNSACKGEADCVCGEEFVPEPGTLFLLGSGLMGLAGYATLRFRSK